MLDPDALPWTSETPARCIACSLQYSKPREASSELLAISYASPSPGVLATMASCVNGTNGSYSLSSVVRAQRLSGQRPYGIVLLKFKLLTKSSRRPGSIPASHDCCHMGGFVACPRVPYLLYRLLQAMVAQGNLLFGTELGFRVLIVSYLGA